MQIMTITLTLKDIERIFQALAAETRRLESVPGLQDAAAHAGDLRDHFASLSVLDLVSL